MNSVIVSSSDNRLISRLVRVVDACFPYRWHFLLIGAMAGIIFGVCMVPKEKLLVTKEIIFYEVKSLSAKVETPKREKKSNLKGN